MGRYGPEGGRYGLSPDYSGGVRSFPDRLSTASIETNCDFLYQKKIPLRP